MGSFNETDLHNPLKVFSHVLPRHGLDYHPFKLSSYNSCLTKLVRPLPYPDNSLCVLLVAGPENFDKQILPASIKKYNSDPTWDLSDPINNAMTELIGSKTKNGLLDLFRLKTDTNTVYISDDEKDPETNLCRLHIQTAGHVSKAAYFHRVEDHSISNKMGNVMGCSIHPKYGGWFVFRGVFIFPELEFNADVEWQKSLEATDFDSRETGKLAVHEFNTAYQANRWRDVIKVKKRYSANAEKFYNIYPPSARKTFLKELVENQ